MGVTLFGLLIILVFVILGYFRGLLRFVAAFAALAVAGLLARVFSLPGQWVAGTFAPAALVPLAGTLVAGIGIFVVGYFVAERFIVKRERARVEAGEEAREPWEGYLGGFLGGVWGLVLVVLCLTGIDTVTTVQETMEQASADLEVRRGHEPAAVTVAPGSLGAQVRESIFAGLVRRANPVKEERRKVLHDFTVVMGDDRLFERFRKHPKVAELATTPEVVALAEDAEVQQLVRDQRYGELLNHPKVAGVARDPDLVRRFTALDLAGILTTVMTNDR